MAATLPAAPGIARWWLRWAGGNTLELVDGGTSADEAEGGRRIVVPYIPGRRARLVASGGERLLTLHRNRLSTIHLSTHCRDLAR
jgi:hypothetical protein